METLHLFISFIHSWINKNIHTCLKSLCATCIQTKDDKLESVLLFECIFWGHILRVQNTVHVLTSCPCRSCGSPRRLKRLQSVPERRSPPCRSSGGANARSRTPPPAWCRAAHPPGTSMWTPPGRRSEAGRQRRRKQSAVCLTARGEREEKGEKKNDIVISMSSKQLVCVGGSSWMFACGDWQPVSL